MPSTALDADKFTSTEEERNTSSFEHYIRSDVIGTGVAHLQGDPKVGNQQFSSGGEGRQGVWDLEDLMQK